MIGQPNPWSASPYGGQAIGPQLFTQPPYNQPLLPTSFGGYSAGNNPYGAQAPYAQPLQHLHQLQQLLQLVPQQLQQLQQLIQLLPQQLQQIQQLVQFVPQQIHQLQQQLQSLQTPLGTATHGVPGFTSSQPFNNPFSWPGTAQGVSPITSMLPFGVPGGTGQVM